MNTAVDQAEGPAKADDKPPRQQSGAPASPDNIHSPASPKGSLEQRARQSEHPTSPPVRKDTNSSTSTNSTATIQESVRSSTREDTAATMYSVGSPILPNQAVFSVKDGSDIAAQRRPSRRRTGPLTDDQRKRAAVIRKLGACPDCKKRRVACHPNHHNIMSWQEAESRFTPSSPSLQDLAPLGGRPISPATSNSKPTLTQDPQKMDIDKSPSQQVSRSSLNESRIRKPLPSGPRPDKPLGVSYGIDSSKEDLQRRVTQFLADPHRSRYTKVSALFVHWQDDDDQGARSAMNELDAVLDQYNYALQRKAIPAGSDGQPSSALWLSREIQRFVENDDQRNVLKVVYYSGYSLWNGDEMVLSSSPNPNSDTTAANIRWSGIQRVLEEATSDVLILMDSAYYYPSLRLVKRKGVLELIAASASGDHMEMLGRSTFTRALSRQLRGRLGETKTALSAAELHASLLSNYSDMIGDGRTETQRVTSFPFPLHFQVSGTKLPSILLAPVPKGRSPLPTPSPTSGGAIMNMTFRLRDESIEPEDWIEWLRLMPGGIRDVVVRRGGSQP